MSGRIYNALGKKPPSEGKSAPAVLSVFTDITTISCQQIPPRSDAVNKS